ncbi:hypothetical protein [Dehalococcoides mccartyi]
MAKNKTNKAMENFKKCLNLANDPSLIEAASQSLNTTHAK